MSSEIKKLYSRKLNLRNKYTRYVAIDIIRYEAPVHFFIHSLNHYAVYQDIPILSGLRITTTLQTVNAN